MDEVNMAILKIQTDTHTRTHAHTHKHTYTKTASAFAFAPFSVLRPLIIFLIRGRRTMSNGANKMRPAVVVCVYVCVLCILCLSF